MKTIKNIRFIFLVLFLLISVYFILSPMVFKKSGIFVSSVDKNNNCTDIKESDVITQVRTFGVKNSEEFAAGVKGVKSGEYVVMVVNGVPAGCTALEDGYLGIDIKDIPSEMLRFGMDIQGGTITSLRPEETENITHIAEIVEKRVKFLKFSQTTVQPSDNLIKVTGLKEDLRSLTKKCEFKTKILQNLNIEDTGATIKIGGRIYPVEILESGIKINNMTHMNGENFSIEGFEFELLNVTNASASISTTVFTNDDISRVLPQLGQMAYKESLQSYQLSLPVELSEGASEKFTKVTEGIEIIHTGQEYILDASLVFELDGKIMSKLNIPKIFVTQPIRSISIIGFGDRSDVESMKMDAEMCLESGMLPVGLKKVGTERLEPKYGKILQPLTALFAFIILASVFGFDYWRYKNWKLGFYGLAFLCSEIVIIFGAVSVTNWIVDLQTIAGIFTFSIISILQGALLTEYEIWKKMGFSILVKNINLVILISSFIVIFTPWRFFGLVVIIGVLVKLMVTNSIFMTALKKYKY